MTKKHARAIVEINKILADLSDGEVSSAMVRTVDLMISSSIDSAILMRSSSIADYEDSEEEGGIEADMRRVEGALVEIRDAMTVG